MEFNGDITNCQRIDWNTGRLYQKEGQQITAIDLGVDEQGDHWVYFNDWSRGVDGFVYAPEFSQDCILSAYDRDHTNHDFAIALMGLEPPIFTTTLRRALIDYQGDDAENGKENR